MAVPSFLSLSLCYYAYDDDEKKTEGRWNLSETAEPHIPPCLTVNTTYYMMIINALADLPFPDRPPWSPSYLSVPGWKGPPLVFFFFPPLSSVMYILAESPPSSVRLSLSVCTSSRDHYRRGGEGEGLYTLSSLSSNSASFSKNRHHVPASLLLLCTTHTG